MVYKNYGTCNLTSNYHSRSIGQTSLNQQDTFTPSETSNDGPTNIEPASFTKSISSDAPVITTASRDSQKLK